MPELLMLVGDLSRASNDNHERFAAAFERAGWKVTTAAHEAVTVARNRVLVAGRPAEAFDLIWPLGFGTQASFLDRMQLLATLSTACFVNSPDALIHLHGKHRWLAAMPETHTSANPETLNTVLGSGGDWVLKPTAGSFGRDVHLFREGEASYRKVERIWRDLGAGYLIAQRYLPSVRDGEHRTLVAGGVIVGTYRRLPGTRPVANLAAGGVAERSALGDEERALIAPIARELADLGAGFATVDTVHPYLMEVNVANPGGLETLERLEGMDLTDRAVRAIIGWGGRTPWASRS